MQIGPRRDPGPPVLRRPGRRPARSSGDTARRSRLAAGGRPSAAASRMPALERPQPLTARPGAPCQPGLEELRPRPRRIVFADELRPRPHCTPRSPRRSGVPDYELKYPALSSQSARSCYAAVFHDQYGEFLELQRQLEGTQAKLQQLGALLTSLPAPRSQNEARVAARVWREFEKKRMDPGFLEKQARCRYLKGKLRHLKAQIQKFDDQRDSDSKGSVYF